MEHFGAKWSKMEPVLGLVKSNVSRCTLPSSGFGQVIRGKNSELGTLDQSRAEVLWFVE
jgi:hypothetical protein